MTNILSTAAGDLAIPHGAHLAAFFLFGLTGAMVAVKRQYDFIGLFVMAFATAAGGGLIRDGLFIQKGPPLITQNSHYITVIVLSAVAAVFFRRHIVRLAKWIAWIDAFCLGVYTVIGTQIALRAGLSVASAVIVGVVSAAGGGLLRDLLAGEEPLMLKPGQFYVLAALVGCMVYLVGIYVEVTRPFASDLAIAVTFVLRILAIQFNWSTAPVSRWNRTSGDAQTGRVG
jgi:uncharacterized membrane protein YeiH